MRSAVSDALGPAKEKHNQTLAKLNARQKSDADETDRIEQRIQEVLQTADEIRLKTAAERSSEDRSMPRASAAAIRELRRLRRQAADAERAGGVLRAELRSVRLQHEGLQQRAADLRAEHGQGQGQGSEGINAPAAGLPSSASMSPRSGADSLLSPGASSQGSAPPASLARGAQSGTSPPASLEDLRTRVARLRARVSLLRTVVDRSPTGAAGAGAAARVERGEELQEGRQGRAEAREELEAARDGRAQAAQALASAVSVCCARAGAAAGAAVSHLAREEAGVARDVLLGNPMLGEGGADAIDFLLQAGIAREEGGRVHLGTNGAAPMREA